MADYDAIGPDGHADVEIGRWDKITHQILDAKVLGIPHKDPSM